MKINPVYLSVATGIVSVSTAGGVAIKQKQRLYESFKQMTTGVDLNKVIKAQVDEQKSIRKP